MSAFRLAPVVAAVWVAASLAALGSLYSQRFSLGDAMDEGSSFRADPEGCKALYESLDLMDRKVLRRTTESMLPPEGSTVLYLGLDDAIMLGSLGEIAAEAARGHRVVVALRGRHKGDGDWGDPGCEGGEPFPGADIYWSPDTPPYEPVALLLPTGEWASFEWKGSSHLWPGSGWRALLTDGVGGVLAAEAKVGLGSLVIVTDLTPFTNRALKQGLEGPWLGEILGDAPAVVFDEREHGAATEEGVLSLMKSYRLHGFILGLGLVTLLWVWSRALPLAPRNWEGAPPSRRGLHEGLAVFLQRVVGPAALLAEARRLGGHPPGAAPDSDEAAVEAFNKINEEETRRRTAWISA